MEAEAKFKKVYMLDYRMTIVNTKDMEGLSKIVKRCLDRIR